jgi:hypothetical protein
MIDIKQALDGNVEDVTARLKGLTLATLTALLAAEQAGQNRKDVINAIEVAHTSASKGKTTYTSATDRGDGASAITTSDVTTPAAVVGTASALDTSSPANIASATTFDPSGAPVQLSEFDLDHVALDANPRANTTSDQNRIDFNDPGRSGREIVEDQLKG